MFEIAKPLVTGVAKDDRIAVNSRDYTALTGGQDPEPVGMVGGGSRMKRQRARLSCAMVSFCYLYSRRKSS